MLKNSQHYLFGGLQLFIFAASIGYAILAIKTVGLFVGDRMPV